MVARMSKATNRAKTASKTLESQRTAEPSTKRTAKPSTKRTAKPSTKRTAKPTTKPTTAKPSTKRPVKRRAKRAVTRVRGGEARIISDLLPSIGGASFRKFGFMQISIVSRWREIIGAKIADVTQPMMIRFPSGAKINGVLHLGVSGAYAPMLQHIEPDILAVVNRFFGYSAVSRIRMVHGVIGGDEVLPIGFESEPEAMVQSSDSSLREVEDDELRAILERMAAGLEASGLPERSKFPQIS